MTNRRRRSSAFSDIDAPDTDAPDVSQTAIATQEDAPARPAKREMRRRTPFAVGGGRYKLQVQYVDPNFREKYHACWFNDQRGTVKRALDGGYEFVTPDEIENIGEADVHSGNTDLNGKVSRIVGSDAERGGPLRAFLMKIDMRWYLEDKALLEKENAAADDAMRHNRGNNPVTNAYGEVKIG